MFSAVNAFHAEPSAIQAFIIIIIIIDGNAVASLVATCGCRSPNFLVNSSSIATRLVLSVQDLCRIGVPHSS